MIALIGAVLGAVWIAAPAFFLDRAKYGPSNDDAGTIFTVSVLGFAYLGFVHASGLVAWLIARRYHINRRAIALLALPVPASVATWLVVSHYAKVGGFDRAGSIAGILVLVTIFLALLSAASHQPWLAGGFVAIATVTIVVGLVIGPLGSSRYQIALLEEAGTPLALVDRGELERVLPGWTVTDYDWDRLGRAEIRLISSERQELVLRLDGRSDSCFELRETCTDLRPLDDGSAVSLRQSTNCGDEPSLFTSIVVVRPTGNWSLRIWRAGACPASSEVPDLVDLERVLATMQPVDATTWVEAVTSET